MVLATTQLEKIDAARQSLEAQTLREVAEEKNARLQEIEFRLGLLPDDILSAQRLPIIAKSATYLQGGNDDQS